MSNAKLAGFVRDITALQSYKDNTVCHAMTTGFGVRFHGFRRISFSAMAKVLKQFDKNMTFKPSPNGVVNLEARDMVDHDTCTGIVDPESLVDAPHNLVRQQPALNAGAVSRHEYKWSRTITDSLLHRLLAHPKVLDVWVEADRISVFVVHDNNLQGGLMQHITRNRKQQTKACKRPPRMRSSKSSWQVRSRPMKPAKIGDARLGKSRG